MTASLFALVSRPSRRTVALTRFAGEDMHLMFVYGTLKRGQPNNQFMLKEESGQAEFVASGRTSTKYPLVIAGSYNIPYLLYVPGRGHQIDGDIYRVDRKMRDFMDDFESHPTYYERMEEDIVVDDGTDAGKPKTVKCWVYFMKNYKPGMLDLPPMASYDTNGPHGLQYVERASAMYKEIAAQPIEETSDLEDV